MLRSNSTPSTLRRSLSSTGTISSHDDYSASPPRFSSLQNDNHDINDGSKTSSEAHHETNAGGPASSESPIAPRFAKQTERGVKRRLDMAKYKSECNDRKMARPVGLSDEQIQTVDSFVFHHIKVTVSSRFHFLANKTQLRECLAERLFKYDVEFPRDIPRKFISHVIDVLGDDYYKYYKNIINKLRHDIRRAIEKLEPVFLRSPKERAKEIRGRDKLNWYTETQEIAQAPNGQVAGFRSRILTKYNGYKNAHEGKVAEIGDAEMQDCARHPFCFLLSIAASEKTDLFPVNGQLSQFEQLVRPSTEAMLLHAWYVDLWDCSCDDPVAWNVQTLRRLVGLVERDREYACANKESYRELLEGVGPSEEMAPRIQPTPTMHLMRMLKIADGFDIITMVIMILVAGNSHRDNDTSYI